MKVSSKECSNCAALAADWMIGCSVLSMLMMYKRSGDKKYLESAGDAVKYLFTLQILDTRDMKNFGMIREDTPQTEVCHPRDGLSAAWALLDAGRITGEKKYADAAQSASGYLAALQETKIKNKRVYGGVYGQSGDYKIDRTTLNIRTSSYFLAAMLKAENNMEYNQYTS